MTEREFESLLDPGHETNGTEFKGPGDRSDMPFFARVVRAILGMANRREGGRVILGVEAAKLEPVGLSAAELASWDDFDILSEAVNAYARPSVSLEPEKLAYRGKDIFIIAVDQFRDVPILCSRGYNRTEDAGPDGRKKVVEILRAGACYVRPRHKPATEEIPSEEAMRELLDLAIDIGVAKFVRRAKDAGLFPGLRTTPDSTSDEDRFREQIKEME